MEINDMNSNKPTYEVGQHVTLKKKHPCGSNSWTILRTGMDFRLQCDGCGHMMLISRKAFEKSVKGIIV